MKRFATLSLIAAMTLTFVGCGESDSATAPETKGPVPVSRSERATSDAPPRAEATDSYAQVVAGLSVEEVEAILGPADSTLGTAERVMRFWTKPNDDEFAVLFVDGIVETAETHEMP